MKRWIRERIYGANSLTRTQRRRLLRGPEPKPYKHRTDTSPEHLYKLTEMQAWLITHIMTSTAKNSNNPAYVKAVENISARLSSADSGEEKKESGR